MILVEEILKNLKKENIFVSVENEWQHFFSGRQAGDFFAGGRQSNKWSPWRPWRPLKAIPVYIYIYIYIYI